jgi:hypothetical protein
MKALARVIEVAQTSEQLSLELPTRVTKRKHDPQLLLPLEDFMTRAEARIAQYAMRTRRLRRLRERHPGEVVQVLWLMSDPEQVLDQLTQRLRGLKTTDVYVGQRFRIPDSQFEHVDFEIVTIDHASGQVMVDVTQEQLAYWRSLGT